METKNEQTEEQILKDKLTKYCKNLNFDWENSTNETVEIKEDTELYYWLCSTRFRCILAFIIEVMQNNIDILSINRYKSFNLLCKTMEMDKRIFKIIINELQDQLIINGKAKVCKDGKVVIMDAK